jgi:hypothetical protein
MAVLLALLNHLKLQKNNPSWVTKLELSECNFQKVFFLTSGLVSKRKLLLN